MGFSTNTGVPAARSSASLSGDHGCQGISLAFAEAALAWPGAQGPGLAAFTAVVAWVASLQTSVVAIVGEYVVRTYREVQGRPTWITRRTIHGGGEGARAGTPLQDSRAA